MVLFCFYSKAQSKWITLEEKTNSYTKAYALCASRGMFLPMPKYPALNDQLNTHTGNERFFLGLRREEKKPFRFHWMDGDVMTWSKWMHPDVVSGSGGSSYSAWWCYIMTKRKNAMSHWEHDACELGEEKQVVCQTENGRVNFYFFKSILFIFIDFQLCLKLNGFF